MNNKNLPAIRKETDIQSMLARTKRLMSIGLKSNLRREILK